MFLCELDFSIAKALLILNNEPKQTAVTTDCWNLRYSLPRERLDSKAQELALRRFAPQR